MYDENGDPIVDQNVDAEGGEIVEEQVEEEVDEEEDFTEEEYDENQVIAELAIEMAAKKPVRKPYSHIVGNRYARTKTQTRNFPRRHQ